MNTGKILTESMIRNAMSYTQSNHAAAHYLRVNPLTYRKYASMYIDEESGLTLYELHKNASGKGVKKRKINTDESTLRDALKNGMNIAHHNVHKLKDAILRFSLLPHQCNKCKFHEKRLIDNKIPLLINFKNGKQSVMHLEDIELLCYNCYFLYVSDIFTKRQEQLIEDINSPKPKVHDFDWDLDYEADVEPIVKDLSGKEFISKY